MFINTPWFLKFGLIAILWFFGWTVYYGLTAAPVNFYTVSNAFGLMGLFVLLLAIGGIIPFLRWFFLEW